MKNYRNWTIEKLESFQVGYSTESGKRGKGRKIKGYQLNSPDGETTKFCDTIKDAKEYIDQYEGGEIQS